jgi:hypothetical protein
MHEIQNNQINFFAPAKRLADKYILFEGEWAPDILFIIKTGSF